MPAAISPPDEEGSRSKERYFSPRTSHNAWDVAISRPSSGINTRQSSRPAAADGGGLETLRRDGYM